MVDPEAVVQVRRPRGMRPSRGYRVFQAVNGVVLTGVVVLTLFPFVNILARSFSQETYIRTGQVNFVPRGFNLTTYKVVMSDPVFWNNYRNTVVLHRGRHRISIVLTTCFALRAVEEASEGPRVPGRDRGVHHVLQRRPDPQLRPRQWARSAQLAVGDRATQRDQRVQPVGDEGVLREPADRVGGGRGRRRLGTYGILLRIVLPLSKAVIATMILFYAVMFWNSWFPAFLYLDHSDCFPVTVYLRNLIAGSTGGSDETTPTETALQIGANIQAVTIVLTVVAHHGRLSVHPAVFRLRGDARRGQGLTASCRPTTTTVHERGVSHV